GVAGRSVKPSISRSKVRGVSSRSFRNRTNATKRSPTRSSGSRIRSTRSRAENFHPHPTTYGDVKAARSRRCAGRTMSATFEPRLPFEEEDPASPFDRPVLSEPLILRQAQDERRVEGLRTSEAVVSAPAVNDSTLTLSLSSVDVARDDPEHVEGSKGE